MLNLLFIQTIVMAVAASMWFGLAVLRKRNDVADMAWGLGFILTTAVVVLYKDAAISLRGWLMVLLVSVWGIRLAIHIGMRHRRKGEDVRYQNWRKAWGKHALLFAYCQVFLLQGLLVLIIAFPVTWTMMAPVTPFGMIDVIGMVLWLTGFLFEAIGDYQLRSFKKHPENRGQIIQSGLWKYSRHPNYFGEVLLWWGIYCISLETPGGWMTIIGPLMITYLILFVSGIPMLEKTYQGNPEYGRYAMRTSRFFPMPPKKGV
ncbi:MAG: DUF1295 domain-containing protein [Desulfobacterales bacterium]|jgi:steroid 5-alpha reductase family enzyme|nr:DUF1295 domain-containing protein [Desulfobacterales bacterium]